MRFADIRKQWVDSPTTTGWVVGRILDALCEQEAIREAVPVRYGPGGLQLPEPVRSPLTYETGGCTDPDNCRLCKAMCVPGARVDGLHHAGIPFVKKPARSPEPGPTLAEQIAFVRHQQQVWTDIAPQYQIAGAVIRSLERLARQEDDGK